MFVSTKESTIDVDSWLIPFSAQFFNPADTILALQSSFLLTLFLLWQTSKRMHDVSYHNFYHVVDVTHSCFRFLRLTDSSCLFSVWEQVALLVAAMCHDLDHPGALFNTKGAIAIFLLPKQDEHWCQEISRWQRHA